jgi:aldehyde:ferredoxin oxidoreductase
MPNGYNGKILHVNLSNLSIEVESPSEGFYRTYMGGSALGLYYLLKNTPPAADPLGAENTLTLALSVLTGAPISGQSRITAVAKSPITGGAGDAQAGGFFPAEMKFSGYDAVVVHGRAENPVYLWIKDGEVELRPAGHLWGKTTGDVEELLKEELGEPKIQVMQIGPSGEKGVRYASIMNNANRANGRTGMGAVMGSKNLKAIVVRGSKRPQIADRKGLNDLARWGVKEFPDSDAYGTGLVGTAEIVGYQNEDGGLPTRNWSSGTFEGWKALDGKTMSETILKERDTCYACVVRCKRVVEVTDSRYEVNPQYGGPEYETLSTFGSYCGIDDLEAVSFANQLCNMYGLDTIACGATIAWAMDCFERGLITLEDTDGVELRFGNSAAMVEMVKKIAFRDGFGDVLAEGSSRAAVRIGQGTEDLAVTVKNTELPAHMPQVKPSLALIYAVNPFGADHQSTEHDSSYADYPERMAMLGLTNPEQAEALNNEKVRFALITQYLFSALDTVNLCQFVFGGGWELYGPDHIVDAVRFITGWDIDIDEVLLVGERRLNMLRAFNSREGFGREQDKLPKKLFQPLKGGESDGLSVSKEEVEAAMDVYFGMAGWDIATGHPTRKKLVDISLGWVADLLEAAV